MFAVAFAYPASACFRRFGIEPDEQDGVRAEYDRLFRAEGLWLEGAEHMVRNEFQRANQLADIMGFYRAFGVQPERERPDALACELEFMHLLIVKEQRALRRADEVSPTDAATCRDAADSFLREHLAPAGRAVGKGVLELSRHAFYRQVAEGLLAFMDEEAPHTEPATAGIAGNDMDGEMDCPGRVCRE